MSSSTTPTGKLWVNLIAFAWLVASASGQGQGQGQAYLPRPIQPTDVDHWSFVLGLSDAQRQFFVGRHEEYLADYAAALSNLGAGLVEQKDKIDQHTLGSWEYAQAYEQFVDRRTEAFRRLERLDDDLFDTLIEPLADQQLEDFFHVRLDRECAVHTVGVMNLGMHRPDSRDLTGLFRDILAGSNEMPMSPDRVLALEREYLTARAPVIRTMSQDWSRAIVRSHKAVVTIVEDTVAQGGEVSRTEYVAMKARIWRKQVRSGAQLATINRRFIRQLLLELPEESAQILSRKLDFGMYPDIYADLEERKLRERLDKLSLENIPAEQSKHLEAFLFLHEERYSALSEEMEELVNEMHAALILSGGVRLHDDMQQYDERMSELRTRRSAIVAQTEALVASVLPEAQRDLFGTH